MHNKTIVLFLVVSLLSIYTIRRGLVLLNSTTGGVQFIEGVDFETEDIDNILGTDIRELSGGKFLIALICNPNSCDCNMSNIESNIRFVKENADSNILDYKLVVFLVGTERRIGEMLLGSISRLLIQDVYLNIVDELVYRNFVLPIGGGLLITNDPQSYSVTKVFKSSLTVSTSQNAKEFHNQLSQYTTK